MLTELSVVNVVNSVMSTDTHSENVLFIVNSENALFTVNVYEYITGAWSVVASPRDHDRAESRPRGHKTSLNVASSTSGARPVDTSTAPQRTTRLRRRWLLMTCARDLLEKT